MFSILGVPFAKALLFGFIGVVIGVILAASGEEEEGKPQGAK